jgi:hypothetical protein
MNDNIIPELLWIHNPSIIFKKFDIYPDNTNNKYNSIVRLLMLSLLFFIGFNRFQWTYISILAIICVTVIGIKDENLVALENEKKANTKTCRRSTIDNPMKNLLPLDDNPEMSACSDDSELVNKNKLDNFYQMENDLGAEHRLRNFITMPSTSLTHGRNKFMDYMSKDMFKDQMCKTDGIHCEIYRDVRFSKHH